MYKLKIVKMVNLKPAKKAVRSSCSCLQSFLQAIQQFYNWNFSAVPVYGENRSQGSVPTTSHLAEGSTCIFHGVE